MESARTSALHFVCYRTKETELFFDPSLLLCFALRRSAWTISPGIEPSADNIAKKINLSLFFYLNSFFQTNSHQEFRKGPTRFCVGLCFSSPPFTFAHRVFSLPLTSARVIPHRFPFLNSYKKQKPQNLYEIFVPLTPNRDGIFMRFGLRISPRQTGSESCMGGALGSLFKLTIPIDLEGKLCSAHNLRMCWGVSPGFVALCLMGGLSSAGQVVCGETIMQDTTLTGDLP